MGYVCFGKRTAHQDKDETISLGVLRDQLKGKVLTATDDPFLPQPSVKMHFE